VLAVTFDMLIPKITLFSQYARSREGIIFQQRPSLSASALTSMYNFNEKAAACMHISAARRVVHNIIQSQPTHTQQLVWLFKTGSAAST